MATDSEPGKNNPPKTHAVLTSKTKGRLKEVAGKCEYCDCKKSPDQLEVFQLSPMARPEYRKENDPVSTIIVLCKDHHAQVLKGELSKSSLKSKIAGRSDKKKKELRSVLQKQDRTCGSSGITRIRDPARFNVFPKDPSDRRR